MAEGSATASRRTLADWRVRLSLWIPAGAVVALLLGVYLETRLWLVAKFPYFLDEGILAQYALIGHDKDQRLISLDVGIRPGLVWMTLFGMRVHIDPLLSIRLWAVLFGLIGLACGILLALRFAGRRAAIAFAVLALFTPILFLYNSLGLRDPVIAGLMVAGLLLEIELARNPRFAIAVLLGLTFAFDLWVKDSGKAALYLLPFSLVYFQFRSPRRIRLGAQWIGNAAVALVMAWAATLPMQLGSAYQHLATTQAALGNLRTFAEVRAHPLRYFNESWPGVRGELTDYLTYPIVVLAVIGLGLGLCRRPRLTALVFVWAAAQVGSAIWLAGSLYPRYLVPAIPFILLLAALGLDELVGLAQARLGSGRRVLLAAVGVGVALLLPALVFDAQLSYDPASAPYPSSDKAAYVTDYSSGFGLKQAVDELQLIGGGRPMVVLTDPITASVPLEVLAVERGLNISWSWVGRSGAQSAVALVVNGTAIPAGVGPLHRIWRYERPDHGTPLEIYVRG
jgi:hypothetical protein